MLNGVPGIFVTVDFLTLLLLKVFLSYHIPFNLGNFQRGHFHLGLVARKPVFRVSEK